MTYFVSQNRCMIHRVYLMIELSPLQHSFMTSRNICMAYRWVTAYPCVYTKMHAWHRLSSNNTSMACVYMFTNAVLGRFDVKVNHAHIEEYDIITDVHDLTWGYYTYHYLCMTALGINSDFKYQYDIKGNMHDLTLAHYVYLICIRPSGVCDGTKQSYDIKCNMHD